MAENKVLSPDLAENLVQEIKYGVHSTFTNMFGMKPESLPHLLENECAFKGDVSGIIGLVQERTEGTFIVTFPKETIFGMLSKVYRKEFTEINQSVKLGVGEVTNIIYGVVKANLNKNGFAFKMAIPNVIIGEQHTVVTCSRGPVLILPFMTPVGPFSVLMSFHSDVAEKAA